VPLKTTRGETELNQTPQEEWDGKASPKPNAPNGSYINYEALAKMTEEEAGEMFEGLQRTFAPLTLPHKEYSLWTMINDQTDALTLVEGTEQPEEGHVLLNVFKAIDWEDACQQRNQLLGWEPNKSMEVNLTPKPHPWPGGYVPPESTE